MGRILASFCLLCLLSAAGRAADIEPVSQIPATDFNRLLELIKPQPGESPWREIPWLTNVRQARDKAIAEDKPLLFFSAADGSPLART
jgi:hypothetical protein